MNMHFVRLTRIFLLGVGTYVFFRATETNICEGILKECVFRSNKTSIYSAFVGILYLYFVLLDGFPNFENQIYNLMRFSFSVMI